MLCLLYLVFLIFSLITRTVLLVQAIPNLDITPFLILKIYGIGIFFDCVTFTYLAIPLFLYALFVPDRLFNCRPVTWLYFFVITYALLFDAAAEYFFFAEFGARFNFIAIDYLIYTTEVIRNIRESYPVNWIFAGIFIINILIFIILRKHIDRCLTENTTMKQRLKAGTVLAILPLLSYVFVDLTVLAITSDNYANELSENGLYNLVAAFTNSELDYDRFYVGKDNKLVLARLHDLVREPNNSYVSRDYKNMTRTIRHEGAEKRLNVMVIVEESMSGEYLKAFGGKEGLTPNLDRLAGESLFFSNLYAAGTRTVRGLEAVTLAIPPLPGTSMIKRPHNENFFSWGSLMQSRGYDTKFIYAGHGFFDNMNYFFAHNGFAIVDKTDFSRDEVTFDNAWGACDEDLFRKVIKEANRSYGSKKLFFSIVMTTSNHRPFTYPGGKIDIPSHAGRNGGVKYADYAIGKLLENARKQPWFNDTLFVIVADHCAGSARKVALPIKNYQIPLLVYAPGRIRPQKIDTLASQIDIAPTVLGLLNFSYTTRFLGKDILLMKSGEGRAFISTYEKLGYLKGDMMVILDPKKKIEYYRFDRMTGKTDATILPEDYLLDALGYYQGTNYLYKHMLDRISS
ncbi:MAG: sulfatase-like hydrolase/transferase [Geobacteraceae bacterium]|nr:sulfatase-like hydrolase/transferase [Geobacteraceae bacterium]